jgi:hypothetical protein
MSIHIRMAPLYVQNYNLFHTLSSSYNVAKISFKINIYIFIKIGLGRWIRNGKSKFILFISKVGTQKSNFIHWLGHLPLDFFIQPFTFLYLATFFHANIVLWNLSLLHLENVQVCRIGNVPYPAWSSQHCPGSFWRQSGYYPLLCEIIR